MAVILPQSVQQDIQSSLPIIPNNGNPGGAYNVASNIDGAVAPQAAPTDPYDWVQPSPYMAEVQRILQQQDETVRALQLLYLQRVEEPAKPPSYSWVTRDGNLGVQMLDENGMPDQDQPIYPLRYPEEESMPQYSPGRVVLPGE